MTTASAPDAAKIRTADASGWCMRLSEGALTADEQRTFDEWIAADPENLAALDKAVRVWRRFGEVATAPEFIDVRERALGVYRRRNQARWRYRFGNWHGLAAMAACAVLLLFAGVWWQSLPDSYRTHVGERRIVMLEDGSRLSLDADTRVDVRLRKDRRELVLLEGRAKFDVAKDPFRPFSVRAGNRVVVATGTSFSVELLRKQMHVVLYEGQVAVVDGAEAGAKAVPLRLRATAKAADTLLKPGRELVASLVTPTASVLPTDTVRSLSWESGQLTFVDEPLASAIERVNRYASRKIALGDARAGALPVSGVFNAGDIDAFLIGIREVLPIEVHNDREALIVGSKTNRL